MTKLNSTIATLMQWVASMYPRDALRVIRTIQTTTPTESTIHKSH